MRKKEEATHTHKIQASDKAFIVVSQMPSGFFFEGYI